MLNHTELNSRPRASSLQIRNVKQWLTNANSAIDSEEVEFIQNVDDLVPVVPKPKTPLRRWIDRYDILGASCFQERRVRNGTWTRALC